MSKQDKEARLAAALRENLRKRKASGANSSPAKAGAQLPLSGDEEQK
jgi:hypothetical protein